MKTITKMIRAKLNFSLLTPEQLLAVVYTVLKCLTGNANFANLPVDLAALKTMADAFAATLADSSDGSRKAIALRDQQAEEMGRSLRALANHVELTAKDNLNMFLSSGFTPRSNNRSAAQVLESTVVTGIEQGPSGVLVVSIKPVSKAKTYELRFGAAGPGGALPASWTNQTLPSVRTPAVLSGLTPGTSYAVQVRAFGLLGYTEWSDSAFRMSI